MHYVPNYNLTPENRLKQPHHVINMCFIHPYVLPTLAD
jgi:hypothetical protein